MIILNIFSNNSNNKLKIANSNFSILFTKICIFFKKILSKF